MAVRPALLLITKQSTKMKKLLPLLIASGLCAAALLLPKSAVAVDEPYIEAMDLVGEYNAYQRIWMHEAWEMTHDKEFMYMLKAENGLLNSDRRHNPANNAAGVDWGFCGINDHWHPEIVSDPRFFEPMWQLEKCWELYQGGTKFHSVARLKRDAAFRSKIMSHFIFF